MYFFEAFRSLEVKVIDINASCDAVKGDGAINRCEGGVGGTKSDGDIADAVDLRVHGEVDFFQPVIGEVGDGVGAVIIVEHEQIGLRAAFKIVVARATDQRISTATALQLDIVRNAGPVKLIGETVMKLR